jgi:hypothetical protein
VRELRINIQNELRIVDASRDFIFFKKNEHQQLHART